MTIINEINLTSEPLSALGVWYTPDIRTSSVIEDVKIRINEYGPAEVKVTLINGSEYTHKVTDENARDAYEALSEGDSPGGVWADVRWWATSLPSNYKPAPATTTTTVTTGTSWSVRGKDTITINGPAEKIALLRSYADFLGLSV